MIADELRRQADIFTDLMELRAKVGRDPSERPLPRERSAIRAQQSVQRATGTTRRGDADEVNPCCAQALNAALCGDYDTQPTTHYVGARATGKFVLAPASTPLRHMHHNTRTGLTG